MIWSREQGVKAFPVLLEVFTREPTQQEDASANEWGGVKIKQNILYWVKDFPDGDSQPFVEEVRRQLPEWSDRQIANHTIHTSDLFEKRWIF